MSSSGSSTTIFAIDKPAVRLVRLYRPDFYSLTINYGFIEVKFFIDDLVEVEYLAAKINEQIEAQKTAAKMNDARHQSSRK